MVIVQENRVFRIKPEYFVFSLTFQIFVNIGMVTGIVPVAGLPLPFMSYGGSSMTVSLIMIALIYNVANRR